MRTENADLRQTVNSLSKLYQEQGKQQASESAKAAQAMIDAQELRDKANHQVSMGSEGVAALKNLIEEYKREAGK